jgi:hypothetical protein
VVSHLFDLLGQGLPLLELRLSVLGLRGLIQQDSLLLDLQAPVQLNLDSLELKIVHHLHLLFFLLELHFIAPSHTILLFV